MRHNRQTFLLLTAIAFAFTLAACAPKVVPDRVAPRKVYLTANPEELFTNLIERNRQVNSLRTSDASLEYRFTFGTRSYSGADLRFAVEKPGKVYARGSASVAGTVFTLFSNGERFWAEVPRDKEIYTGGVTDQPRPSWGEDKELWESFQPSILLEALLIDDLANYDERSIATHTDFYIINLFDRRNDGRLALRRTIYIEREGLTVRRHRVYSEEGDLMTEAWLYKYVEVDGVQLPELLRIERYWEELSLKLSLSNLKLNADIPDDLFIFDGLPAGYELIDLDNKKTMDERDSQDAESGKSEPAGS